jgi:dimethylargininase
MVPFTKAMVRKPGPSMVNGLSTAGLGTPDFKKALAQHAAYVEALRTCGLAVTVLEADDKFPDSVFIEDTAVVCESTAVITRPEAPSRLGEEAAVAAALKIFQPRLEAIRPPGTVEGGDVLRAGERFYIGVSGRTNPEGARQLAGILRRHGYAATLVRLREVLHLKTGVAYLENNRLLACGEFLGHSPEGTGATARPPFSSFTVIPVPAGESYAANSLWVNGKVLVPAGFPATREAVEKAGYETLPLEVSEFRKLDGGLSCLSLRF